MADLHYDAGRKVMRFSCAACGREGEYDVSAVELVKHHPEDRFHWGLCIGTCPGCGSTHHLNCNLPDEHPDAGHINALLRDRHGAELPPARMPWVR